MSESQRSRRFLFIGGLGAVLASLCCLGPLLLLALGFSGAWLANLTALEPYRPIFIILSLIALFFAWQRIFRPVPSCQPGEPCALSPDRRRHAVIFWGVLALILLALVFPYLLPLFYYDYMDAGGRQKTAPAFSAFATSLWFSNAGAVAEVVFMKRYFAMLMMTLAVNQPVWAASRTVTLAIPGMSCAACPITLRIALNRVTGVTATTMNIDSRQATVTFDDAKTDVEALIRATGDAGYPSTLIQGVTQ